MDKFEYKVRADEILELIGKGEYAEAVEIADTIDWRRVKSVTMLCTISDLYKINKRYEDAKNVLYLAYERRPGGRTICYALCELCIKTGEFVQAVNFYKEFIDVAPRDSGRYILQYKLLEAQDVSLEERIEVLEELKKADYREKWAYELAYLYHMVGQTSRCVEECDDLILWFGDGKYIYKAMELKMQHQPLTADQQIKYNLRLIAQKKVAEKKAADSQMPSGSGNVVYPQMPSGSGNVVYPQMPSESRDVVYPAAETVMQSPEPTVENVDTENSVPQEAEEPEIQVKTMDVGQYNTINLQAELAAGLQEILRTDVITGAIMSPMMEPEVAGEVEEPKPQAEEVRVEVPKFVGAYGEEVEETEVFFGETGEISQVQNLLTGDTGDMKEITLESLGEAEPEGSLESVDPEEASVEAEPETAEMTEVSREEEGVEESETVEITEVSGEEAGAEGQTNVARPEVSVEEDKTAQTVMEQMRLENAGIYDTQILTAQPPKAIASVLSQDSDGQLRLVMPEREAVEKQITGQLNIEDILAEWERMKQESEEKRKEEVRRHVQEQTGTMFTEFEASIRDGLLEKLEKGEQVDLDTLQVVEKVETAEESVEEVPESDEPYEIDEAEENAEVEEVVEAEDAAEETSETDEIEEITEVEEVSEEPEEEALETDEVEEIAEVEEVSEEPEEETLETDEVEEIAEVEEVSEEPEEEAHETDEVEEIAEVEEVSEEPEEEAPETDEVEEIAEVEEVSEELEEEAHETDGVEEIAEVEEVSEEPEEEAHETDEVEEILEVEEDAEEPEYAPEPVERRPVRALTREERELYAPFIQSRSAKENLVTAIDSISMAAYTGNLVVTGEEGMDTMSLAKNIVREIQMTDSNFSGKVAKVSGEGLNQRNVAATINQLNNGALIIQKASGMNEQTAEDIYRTLQQENLGIVIVLEDTKRAINNLFAACPKLENCFTARMDVEALSNDTLVAFGRKYAREMEFSIDELGILALHTRIEEMQTSDHVVTVLDVKKIMDEAMHHASRKTFKHFLDVLFARRYDDEDMIILTEKDFV